MSRYIIYVPIFNAYLCCSRGLTKYVDYARVFYNRRDFNNFLDAHPILTSLGIIRGMEYLF